MSRFHSYINNTLRLLDQYEGIEPFALYSKKYFSANKKFGSKDRKWIVRLSYNYFRTSHLFNQLSAEVLLAAEFLCSRGESELLKELRPEWVVHLEEKASFKREFLGIDKGVQLFPWVNKLSHGLDLAVFQESFYEQPSLFLRTRPGENLKVITALMKHHISFQNIGEDCIRLENATDVKEMITINRQVVIQDLSSQRVSRFLELVRKEWIAKGSRKYKVWDCCAASGGKSILAKDYLPVFELTVSDVREGILNNLASRFKEAGISSYQSFKADLSLIPVRGLQQKFDLIIADLPCSGSGTWGRNPENLWSFKETKIADFAALQKKIVDNILPSLKTDGFLLYCTCSVFQEENEQMVEYLQVEKGFRLINSTLLNGYSEKADSLFAALFISAP